MTYFVGAGNCAGEGIAACAIHTSKRGSHQVLLSRDGESQNVSFMRITDCSIAAERAVNKGGYLSRRQEAHFLGTKRQKKLGKNHEKTKILEQQQTQLQPPTPAREPCATRCATEFPPPSPLGPSPPSSTHLILLFFFRESSIDRPAAAALPAAAARAKKATRFLRRLLLGGGSSGAGSGAERRARAGAVGPRADTTGNQVAGAL